MKTRILLLLALFILGKGMRSQGMPVYDNTNFIALGKSLIESAKQTSQLLKTVKFLKEQKERLEEVTDVVKQLQAVQEIVNNNRRLYETVQQDLREILESPQIKPSEVEQISKSFQSILETSMDDVEFMQLLLTSNYFRMSDSERLAVLQAQRQRSRKRVAEIKLRTRRYRTIISFRQMQERINTRESHY